MKEIKQLEWDYNLKQSNSDIYKPLAICKIDNNGFDYFYYKAEFVEYNNRYEVKLWVRNGAILVAYSYDSLLDVTQKANEWHFNFVNKFLS